MAKILVADDETSVRQSLTILLGDQGHEIYAAWDGNHALRILTNEPNFDLIISNVKINKKMKKKSSFRHIPVILMSRKIREYDVPFFIGKPFKINNMLAYINYVLQP
jgi:CheY-like chemotaxis protein